MWPAFILIAVLIFYGSVFPFNFHPVSINSELFAAFIESWQVPSSHVDVFANVALFVPLAGVGMLASPRFVGGVNIALIGGIGLAVAVVSQFSQFYVPARNTKQQ